LAAHPDLLGCHKLWLEDVYERLAGPNLDSYRSIAARIQHHLDAHATEKPIVPTLSGTNRNDVTKLALRQSCRSVASSDGFLVLLDMYMPTAITVTTSTKVRFTIVVFPRWRLLATAHQHAKAVPDPG
ncbi:hypothetical protein, partial [Burkholderia sp. ABCPW 11]|uniref:hypothetical protein n=1 Tax=Burkholderia sp. ABCPW 11 TaxID=1637859 RepID=UPI000AB6E7F3